MANVVSYPIRLDPEKRKEVARLFKEGASIVGLALKFNTSASEIHQAIREALKNG